MKRNKKNIIGSIVLIFVLGACSSVPSWMGGEKKAFVPLPGERLDVLPSGVEFKADEALKTVSIQLPSAQENAAWAQHTGQLTAETANPSLLGDLSQKQSVSVGDGAAFSHTLVPRPVVAGGFVFAMDATGHVSAHSVNDVSQKSWVSNALVDEGENEVVGGGLAYADGKIFATSGRGKVAAINSASGETMWTASLGLPLRSAPRIAGDALYVITMDSQTFALDIATGKTRWTHRGINETAGIMNSVSPAVVGDMVLAPYGSGELYALRMEGGDEVWRASLSQGRRTSATATFAGIGGDPVVDDAVVFAVSSGGTFSVLSVLSGQPVWEKPISSINTPWVVGDTVFVLSEENTLVAMMKFDGRVHWSKQLPRFEDEDRKLQPIVFRGPVMAAGKLFLVNNQGEMLVLDPATGEAISTLSVASDIATSPVVASGKIFLVGRDATLYSYQ